MPPFFDLFASHFFRSIQDAGFVLDLFASHFFFPVHVCKMAVFSWSSLLPIFSVPFKMPPFFLSICLPFFPSHSRCGVFLDLFASNFFFPVHVCKMTVFSWSPLRPIFSVPFKMPPFFLIYLLPIFPSHSRCHLFFWIYLLAIFSVPFKMPVFLWIYLLPTFFPHPFVSNDRCFLEFFASHFFRTIQDATFFFGSMCFPFFFPVHFCKMTVFLGVLCFPFFPSHSRCHPFFHLCASHFFRPIQDASFFVDLFASHFFSQSICVK